ncbi:TPA: glycosyltransferase 61 family protein [Klebsiella michiganensis]|uniref:glycosyltransferase 61 family protein n=2 Tax=Klebsiella michiganensis TaxID=1134687 RepID=UPI000666CD99|nr:glycosyltransferase 61 family protein [Klebsiella michiganensis]MBS0929046.1 glycosyltransferase family 61 protein [Klebsiella michiganensis]MDG9985404.1 glycosyltransferase family 61 protein [Klebsiella michiganensis]MDH0845649.1 glycosyltransferase family 61 protein [Klebsiella michiganensis]HDS2238090.1 glycosyltransferase family 61 protein [Klebsiella michiganensis]HDS8620760.1 glycosyltransferase family 61 protein [Klebsiella michiganensis]
MRTIISISKKELEVTTYKNAVILPFKKGKNIWGLGGVISCNNTFVDESGFYSYWASFGGIYNFECESVFDFDVIWFGIFTEHWGHFIVDNISRMWFLLNENKGKKIAYVSKSGKKMHGNYLRFMELLGVSEEDLILVTKPTKFKSVVIPEYSKNDNTYSECYVRIFDRVVNNALACPDSKQSIGYGEKIYLSRNNYKHANGKEIGGELIENIFLANNYKPISPEKLVLEDQVKLWNRASEIVCMNGTLPLNICFSRIKTIRVIVLNKTMLPHENLFDFQKIFNVSKVDYIDIFEGFYKKWAVSLGDGPFILTATNQLKEYLHSRNMNDAVFDNLDYFRFGSSIRKLKFALYCYGTNKAKNLVKKILAYFR